MDLAGNQVQNNVTANFTVVTTLDSGPQVISVQRYGFHAQPTSIVITFNQDMNPTTTSNVNAYQILAPGPDRVPGTADDVNVPISSATYNAATRTVTLVPAHSLYLYDEYLLIVKGTGSNAVTDANGVALDGKANGQPGSDYMTTFGQQNLAGPAPSTASKAIHMPSKSVLKLGRVQTKEIKGWQAIISSGGPVTTVATVKQSNRVHPRQLTIRKKSSADTEGDG